MPTMSDSWFLHEMTLDYADQGILEALFASPSDANGRGIALSLTCNGQPVDTAGAVVVLEWKHLNYGNEGAERFEAVDAASGKWKVRYPTAMQHAGKILARITVALDGETITSSREFAIRCERRIVSDEAVEASNDFSMFQEAIAELTEATSKAESAIDGANTAATRAASAAEDAIEAAHAAEGIASKASEEEKSRVLAESARASAEEARAKAEATRVAAESARASAESERAAAEEARESSQQANDEAQAKNDADQALNNEAARNSHPYVCGEGEYDAETFAPTVANPIDGRIYLVPLPAAFAETMPAAASALAEGPLGQLAAAVAAGNAYVEWLHLNGAWEQVGVAQEQAAPITTDEIDEVAGGSAPKGDSVLNLTGLSYLWAKLKSAFAAVSHRHRFSDLDGTLAPAQLAAKSVGTSAIADGAVGETQLSQSVRDSISHIPETINITRLVFTFQTSNNRYEITFTGSDGIRKTIWFGIDGLGLYNATEGTSEWTIRPS